jgi:hypothetical protein
MSAASFTTSMRFTPRPSPPKPSLASALCTALKKMPVASLPSCDARFAKPAPSRCSTICEAGWKNLCALVHKERDRGRDPLCALALACAHPLRRRWTVGDRQLGGRTGASRRRPRTQELPFLWLELRRRTSCRNLLAGRIGETQWTRSRTVSPPGLHPHRRAPVNRIDELLPWNLAAEDNTDTSPLS